MSCSCQCCRLIQQFTLGHKPTDSNGLTDVAELVGHASTAMIHRHDGHLAEKARALRVSLDHVRGQQE